MNSIFQIIEGKADRQEQLRGYNCPGITWARTPKGVQLYIDNIWSQDPDDIEANGKYVLGDTTLMSTSGKCKQFTPNIPESQNVGFYPDFSQLYKDGDEILGYYGKIVGILRYIPTREERDFQWGLEIKDFRISIDLINYDKQQIKDEDLQEGKKVGFGVFFQAKKEGEAYLRCISTIRKIADTIEELLLEKEKLEINERA
ncbi:MAG: hypothetical protein PHH70_01825 [Candidatus Gracilibacteria bacterium]|nr:hypothetical protein [Candidatus Gracilibacteria bacterium]